jgi:hypothetical protein
MSPDDIFQICNMLALAGWVALLASPFVPNVADRVSALLVPILLSTAYAGLVLAYWSTAEGGFDSLPNVMLLFTQPEIALAGWIHYLAFDLLIGGWEVRTARSERIPFMLVVPCLALTFLFGPAGYLAFSALRAARAAMPSKGRLTEGASR